MKQLLCISRNIQEHRGGGEEAVMTWERPHRKRCNPEAEHRLGVKAKGTAWGLVWSHNTDPTPALRGGWMPYSSMVMLLTGIHFCPCYILFHLHTAEFESITQTPLQLGFWV